MTSLGEEIMERGNLIHGLKILEQQIADTLDRVDATRDKFMPLLDGKAHNSDVLIALIHTLQTDVMQLRHLFQQVIYKTALLADHDGKSIQSGPFNYSSENAD